MKEYSLEFDGGLLLRGFWLYVWRIRSGKRVAFYVGRTGDSSSLNAASPFNRLSRHLDLRPTAKSNSLVKRLDDVGFRPADCRFEFRALGPLFEENANHHKERRDATAALERYLADRLSSFGLQVLGVHPRPGSIDSREKRRVNAFAEQFRS